MTAFQGWTQRIISEPSALQERQRLLESRGLSVPGGEDLVLGFYDGDRLAATGALVGQIVQGVAVASEREGEGGAATVVTALIKAAVARGARHLFLYSKPEEGKRFEALGFEHIATARLPSESPGGAAYGVSLYEWGWTGIGEWKEALLGEARGKPRGAGAIVVNCNPFTRGHRALVETAARASAWLYVLVVEEDRSLFPFDVRFELVRRGTADIPNLSVLRGGPYVVSSATFPAYFTRPRPETGERPIAELHAALDLEVFRAHIAPALGVKERFVGTEPYCPTTSIYNSLMKGILEAPRPGSEPIAVRVMERFEVEGRAVSASRVRELIRGGDLSGVRPLVPDSTWDWLASAEAAPVIERIRASDSRH